MVGIRNIGSFDVQAACSGFLYALTIASQFIADRHRAQGRGGRRRQDVVDHRLHRPRDLRAVRRRRRRRAARAERERLRHHGRADPLRRLRHACICIRRPAAAACRRRAETVAKRLHYVHQEGAAVYKFAVASMAEVAGEIMARNNLRADMIDWLVPHQANKRIIESTAERMGLPMDKVMVTIHKYGNTTNGDDPALPVGLRGEAQARRPAGAGGLRRRLHLGRHLRAVDL